MKALTLWQPWASLIAWGEKQYETRSWPTSYRGPLAIHAGLNDDTQEFLRLNVFYRVAFALADVDPGTRLPAGAVLCLVNLVDCVPTAGQRITQQEQNFGDWSTGRFAWKLELVEVFTPPIPAKGKQGLWEWEKP